MKELLRKGPKTPNTACIGRRGFIAIDELFSKVRSEIIQVGVASKHAIPETYPLLRTLQLSHCGYRRAL